MVKNSEQFIYKLVAGLLRPVLRICLKKSIKLKELNNIVKQVFVEVAVAELDKNNEEPSMSRISVMTGVHRKDVTAIFRQDSTQVKPQNLIAKIVHQWKYNSTFKTKSGKPRVLSCGGRHSEFAKLVESVNGNNVSPYTVLFEMERMSAVQKQGNRIKLLWENYISDDVEEGLEMLVEDSNDLIISVEENIYNPASIKNLHLKTEYDAIPASSALEVRKWFIEEGSQFHVRASKFLSKVEERGRNQANKIRVALGTFSFVEDKKDSLKRVN